MRFQAFIRSFFAILLAVSATTFSGCGDKKDGVAGATDKVVVPPSGPAASPANPLLVDARKGTVERHERSDKKYAFTARVALERDGKTTHYAFRTRDLNPQEAFFVGYPLDTQLCADDLCLGDLASPEVKAPISVALRCTSRDCNSSLATVKGTAEGPYAEKTMMIEHQVMENLELRVTGSVFIESHTLANYMKKLEDYTTVKTGVLTVDRIPGTPIQNVRVYVKMTPQWNNEVFGGRANPQSDLTRMREYFVEAIGGLLERGADGKKLNENVFNWTLYPNQNQAGGSFMPGRVKIVWNWASGQLGVSLQDAFNYPNPDQKDGGTLQFGVISERLVKPALDAQGSETADPFWLW